MFIRFLMSCSHSHGDRPGLALQSDCLAMASNQPRIIPTALTETALEADQVKITFIGHSSFIIESPAAPASSRITRATPEASCPTG